MNINASKAGIDSTAVSVFLVILVELTNTVFVNSTNITTNIETAVLSRGRRWALDIHISKLTCNDHFRNAFHAGQSLAHSCAIFLFYLVGEI